MAFTTNGYKVRCKMRFVNRREEPHRQSMMNISNGSFMAKFARPLSTVKSDLPGLSPATSVSPCIPAFPARVFFAMQTKLGPPERTMLMATKEVLIFYMEVTLRAAELFATPSTSFRLLSHSLREGFVFPVKVSTFMGTETLRASLEGDKRFTALRAFVGFLASNYSPAILQITRHRTETPLISRTGFLPQGKYFAAAFTDSFQAFGAFLPLTALRVIGRTTNRALPKSITHSTIIAPSFELIKYLALARRRLEEVSLPLKETV